MSAAEQHEADVETQPFAAMNASKGARLQELDAMMWILLWMGFSAAVILFNKWLFGPQGGFPHPLTLSALHMGCCFIVFGAMRKLAPDAIRLTIMPDANVKMSWSQYVNQFLCISCFFAIGLGAGNSAYMFCSVAFVQMVKPANCVFASFAAFALGIEAPTYSHVIIVSTIAFGVFFASLCETHWSTTGATLQLISSMSEGLRLALMQRATTTGMKLDPVTTVFYFSGACTVLLSLGSFAAEWPVDFGKLCSPWVLLLNCAMAVVLNAIIAVVIKKTSAVVFTLAGIGKDLVVVCASCFFFLARPTMSMFWGYTVSVLGLCMYKVYKDNLVIFKEYGFLVGMSQAMRSAVRRKL